MRHFIEKIGLNQMQGIAFEQFVFNVAERLLPGYKGGVWHTQALGNTVILLLPVPDGEVTINTAMGEEIKTDRVTASAAFSVLVVNWFLNNPKVLARLPDEALNKLTDAYYMLRDNIENVPDQKSFFDFID